MNHPERTAGLTLLELLIGLCVLSLGTVGLLQWQRLLAGSADEARQRSAAMRLAEEAQERLRAFDHVETDPADVGGAWQERVTSTAEAVAFDGTQTLQRHTTVTLLEPLRLKAMSTHLQWPDRDAQTRSLVLHGLLAGVDPQLGVVATLARDTEAAGASGGAAQRHPSIPVAATDLDARRSAFKPRAEGPLTWVFDRSSGEVIERCETPVGVDNTLLTPSMLLRCAALSGWLLSGQVRFATHGDLLGAQDAEQPADPVMSLALRLQFTSTGHPSPGWECDDDAPDHVPPGLTLRTLVSYHCVVQPAGQPPAWSGRLDVIAAGWVIGRGAGEFQVCRYSADHDHDGRIEAAEHPAVHQGVSGPLGAQNFLVVRGTASCPVDTPGRGLDDGTVPHQP